MNDIKQKVLEKLAKAMKRKSWKEIQIIPKWKTKIEEAIQDTIQFQNEAFRKECKECDFKDIDQKIFAELEKLKAYNFSVIKGFGVPQEDIKKLKQKFGVDEI